MPIVGDYLDEPAGDERAGERSASVSDDWDVRHHDKATKSTSDHGIETKEAQVAPTFAEARTDLIHRLKSRTQRGPKVDTRHRIQDDASSEDNGSRSPFARHSAHNEGELKIYPPSSIERPRSALHSGDFHNKTPTQLWKTARDELSPSTPKARGRDVPWFSTSPTTPWFEPQHRLPSLETEFSVEDKFPAPARSVPSAASTRARALSVQSSSFIFRPPTSPLAMHSNSSDLDGLHELGRHRSRSPDKASRRRTHSPRSLRAFKDLPFVPQIPIGAQARAPLPSRRENTFPYQAHQPRRSLSSFSDLSAFPHTQKPSARARRPSITSESSPMHPASLVGRYEESILRGRMSTNASKPVDFVAHIGVLGKGQCRPSLKCPRHITVPFPAYFYNYGHYRDHTPSSTDGPSPYVGQIEFANIQQRSLDNDSDASTLGPSKDASAISGKTRSQESSNRKLPPGGGYRIPQKGQIQLILKNPHKTAVKLFLVPYDLTDMQPGQKTFVRQRSFSAGPIIDMPLTSRKNLGSDRPEAALCNSDDPNDRPILRYLIHLHICCTAKDHFYLYKGIRVVFANRVPDGKEKLRQEIQLPEPKFTDYKLAQEAKRVASSREALLSPLAPPKRQQHTLDYMDVEHSVTVNNGSPFQFQTYPSDEPPALTNPFSATHNTEPEPMDLDSPASADVLPLGEPSPYTFERLDRELYSGGSSSNGSRPQTPKPGEGLLAQQIRRHRSPDVS